MTIGNKVRFEGFFFDLDGTLLQVEMRKFIPAYARGLAEWFVDITDRKTFTGILLDATIALLQHQDGRQSNEEFLLEILTERLNIDGELFNQRLGWYCEQDLRQLAELIQPHPSASAVLDHCRQAGLRLVLATNPVFPRSVVAARLRWGGLPDYPFELITSYENSRFCKPHPGYFTDILTHLGLEASRCLMIGNDTEQDLAAQQVGITTFLADTWLVDRRNGMFTADYRGDLEDLYQFAVIPENGLESLT